MNMKWELAKSVVLALEHPRTGHRIVADEHLDAPAGCGLRVTKTVKTQQFVSARRGNAVSGSQASRARWRMFHRILDGKRMVSPATMNTPNPRWCSVRGFLKRGSTHAFSTSRTKKL